MGQDDCDCDTVLILGVVLCRIENLVGVEVLVNAGDVVVAVEIEIEFQD